MDWGLLRSNLNNPFLREKIMYPRVWYYYVMISNLILRFAWIMTLAPMSIFHNSALGNDFLILLLSMMEAFRRSQWSLFRVENENVNNLEKYRNILEIPKLSDEERHLA